ncbi:hypothetical protein F0562_014929 [Nyssa sinensis]|uniref:Late embryogenesis abundant protein LEA-2 subgroup domain-containing protein n=1 Tax=Nyssa sinensis TaxID=561372 RepID=A0A5J4ZRY9_9ASTE|nr:hypothetical protein F0562_014929 [Nyssa sinensis]
MAKGGGAFKDPQRAFCTCITIFLLLAGITALTVWNQAITQPVILPPLFHEKHSTVALSPILGGGPVPVSVEVTNGLVMDEAYGMVGLRLVLLGKMRWKAGAIRTGRYGIYVKCDVLVGLKKGFVGQVPLLQSPQCKVDI